MNRSKLVGILILAAVGAITAVAYASSVSRASSPKQASQTTTATKVLGSVPDAFQDVVLSSQDDAVLHLTFFASDLLTRPGTDRAGNSGGLKRVVSFAGYVTVQENWETTFTDFFDTLEAGSSNGVIFSTDYDLWPNPGGAEYDVTITPKPGITWGTVIDVNDLDFVPKATVAH